MGAQGENDWKHQKTMYGGGKESLMVDGVKRVESSKSVVVCSLYLLIPYNGAEDLAEHCVCRHASAFKK